jgi:CRISPR-associated protein (TIGR03986 family)
MAKPRETKRLQEKKPYAFAAVPAKLATRPPIWHDGAAGGLSGELRCELRVLTPTLVGWERTEAAALDDATRTELGELDPEKPVLYPLRAPDGERPVILPGDSLKGLLRHELGALLGAPMERVDERLYSYRPNLSYPDDAQDRVLEPRLAKVLETREIQVDGKAYRVPRRVQLWGLAERGQQTYYPRTFKGQRIERPAGAHRYRGGMGAGELLADHLYPQEEKARAAREARKHVALKGVGMESLSRTVSDAVVAQYEKTLRHYFSKAEGHFSRRHPGVRSAHQAAGATQQLQRAAGQVFQKDDVIWVEWDVTKNEVVSFGWHYYYRWAYQDTVRTRGRKGDERAELAPTEEERIRETTERHVRPRGLTAVRRLFGYTGDSAGSKDIGKGNYSQLMGRISINSALELVRGTDKDRFLPPTFLRELGQPRPSAVEHYLQQPQAATHRNGDDAMLRTYGDLAGHDEPGELAGRKFYLDRKDAYGDKPRWEDRSEENRREKRSTLALEASRPHTIFRFTVRFRDLEEDELAAVMLALCPDQFAEVAGGEREDGYCSKLGYARPLGWGSVRITVAELHLLERTISADGSTQLGLRPQIEATAWFAAHSPLLARGEGPALVTEELLRPWMALHYRNHPLAGDYPTARLDPEDAPRPARPSRGPMAAVKEKATEEIFTYHTQLRAQHSRQRRYRRPPR